MLHTNTNTRYTQTRTHDTHKHLLTYLSSHASL